MNDPTLITREACQRRLGALRGEIAALKTDIATADMTRQARRGRVDPARFGHLRDQLRRKQAEAAEVVTLMARLPGRRDALKDMLIAVLRENYDDAGWRRVMDEAHRRLDAGEAV